RRCPRAGRRRDSATCVRSATKCGAPASLRVRPNARACAVPRRPRPDHFLPLFVTACAWPPLLLLRLFIELRVLRFVARPPVLAIGGGDPSVGWLRSLPPLARPRLPSSLARCFCWVSCLAMGLHSLFPLGARPREAFVVAACLRA